MPRRVFAALPPRGAPCCDRVVRTSLSDSRRVLGLDAGAHAILHRAGIELARMALALTAGCGGQPVAVAARVLTLDERILAALREALAGTAVTLAQPDGALAAAHLALSRPVAWQNF